MIRTAQIFAIAGLLGFAQSSMAAVVYSNNFDAPATVGAGVSVSGMSNLTFGTATGSYAGSNGKSWERRFGYNASGGNPATASTLTLSNLAAHTQISIDMMLGFLNSWDSTNGGASPDYLDVYIDGNLMAKLTTVGASGTVSEYGGGTLVAANGQIDGFQFFSDDLVDMATASFLTFAHSASTLTLTLRASGGGWQGGSDELWGIDSLVITSDVVAAVPEPASCALWLATGVAIVAARRRNAAAAR